MAGQLGFELQGTIGCGVLLYVHRRELNLSRLTQKAFERYFGVSAASACNSATRAIKLAFLSNRLNATSAAGCEDLDVNALIRPPSDLFGIGDKGQRDRLMPLVG